MIDSKFVSLTDVMHFPDNFIERLQTLLAPADYAPVLAALAEERVTCGRLNPLVCHGEDGIAQLQVAGFSVHRISEVNADAFWIPATQRRALTEHALLQRGCIYLQNASSMLPPLFLAPQAGEEVLDLTAAPGSKTLQLAVPLQQGGRLAAVEKITDRFYQLKRNLLKHGAGFVHTYNKDGSQVYRQVPERFDRVLLDAPCSSEGQFQRSNPASYEFWSLRKIQEMARKQTRLLYSAIHCCKPGGTIVYSTCTFAPEENEAIIAKALHEFGAALQIETIDWNSLQRRPGLTQWQGQHFPAALQLAVRVLPNDIFEGFFVCKLKKRYTTLK